MTGETHGKQCQKIEESLRKNRQKIQKRKENTAEILENNQERSVFAIKWFENPERMTEPNNGWW
jgi:hypothetical protein